MTEDTFAPNRIGTARTATGFARAAAIGRMVGDDDPAVFRTIAEVGHGVRRQAPPRGPRGVARLSRIAGLLAACLMVGFAMVPVAHAESGYLAYLDLPSTNGDGAGAGGLNPALPMDPEELRTALDEARAAGVAPQRYATLLHQYWLTVATRNADIDLATWDPDRGVPANSRTFTQVYVNYFRLNNAHPDFYWVGLAGLAGGSFASGFFDMGDVAGILTVPGIHQVGSTVADLLRGTPGELLDLLPTDIRLLGTEGERLTAEDLTWYQTRLMIMQKHIFIDQVPMHEAYASGGLAAVEEMYRAGVLDENAVTAWREIDAGTPAGLADAALRMTDREQNQIIADQWDVTSQGRGVMGRVMTYVSTLAGKAAVPGVVAPGVFAPTTLTAGGMSLRTPLPSFNWADRDTRWTYIVGDLLPRYLELSANEAAARPVLAEPFSTKLADGRLVRRLPDLVADMTSLWQLTA
ncbi:hypothetical protein [Nocardia huaxiensis]|uniref:hypothetical protein n=1 Tax=Nocardia huaxiensis TaxID=2755382 RepID=UPI001E4DF154|nr:hypothetical protein [Nocardia huaxiensis]UFS96944.1 hypothetical protein LPY97_03140 [Nocardia huaxiensis]